MAKDQVNINYRLMKRLLLAIVISFTGYQAMAQSKLVDKIVAIVGDKIILKSDIEIQYQQFLSQGQAVGENIHCQIMDQMLLQKMLLAQAEIDSIVVSEDEVEGELDRRIRYFISLIGSKEKMEEYYKKTLLEIKEDFRGDIKELLLAERMRSDIIKDIKVTPAEVKQFFREIPEDSLPFFNAEVELSQIVIAPEISEEQKAMAMDKIQKLRERIQEGEKLSTLAIIYSEDPGSAQNGGELGFFNRGEMVPAFEAAAFKLKSPGDLSEIIESDFGYHILELIERRGEKINVRHILVKPQMTSFDLQKTKRKLDTLYQAIAVDSTMTFTEAVEKYSDDEETKHNGGILVNQQSGATAFEMDQLDASLYFVIDSMKVGELSRPVLFTTKTGQQQYRLVLLRSQTKPHQANLEDDYHRIKTVALTAKQQEKMEKWLQKTKEKTYIQIDPEFMACEQIQKWSTNQNLTEK